ncbi:MAG: hypothetical protein ACRC35_11875 [Angustibacter sp.]
MVDNIGAERPVALAVCGADVEQVAMSWGVVSARRDWWGWSEQDLPLAVVTGHEQRLSVAERCPGATVVATGAPGWPAATAVAQAWASALAADRTVIAVRAGTLPALDQPFLAAARAVTDPTSGTAEDPGPTDLVVLPPGSRVDVDPRTRGSLAEHDVDTALAAAGVQASHPALRYDRPAVRGPAFAATDLAGQARNALMVDPLAEVSDDLVDVAARARREHQSPFWAYDAIVGINRDAAVERWRDLTRRATALGFAERLERQPAVDHPGYPTAGAALSHRAVVEDAWRRRLRHVLLLEDDVVFRRDTRALLADANAVFAKTRYPGTDSAPQAPPWDLLYLGVDAPELAGRVDDVLPPATRHPRLRLVDRRTHNFHAQVIRASAFDLLLDELPRTIADAEHWCERWTATSWFLSEQYTSGRLRALTVWPRVAAQAEQLTDRRVTLHPDERTAFVL